MPDKQIFEHYASLEAQKREIEQEQETLRQQILGIMNVEGKNQIQGEMGRFTKIAKRHWIYSEVVKQLEEGVKERKAEEQAKGTASCEIKETIMFLPKDYGNH